MQRRTRLIGRVSFIMPLNTEFIKAAEKLPDEFCLDEKSDFNYKQKQTGRSSVLTSELSPLGVELLFSSF
jgi:hypothetical protein